MTEKLVRQEPISLQASLVPGGEPLVLSLPAGRTSTLRIECLSGSLLSPILQVEITMADPEETPDAVG